MSASSLDQHETAGGPSFGANSPLAPFVGKLYEILSRATDEDCIQWGPNGDTIVVTDQAKFAREVLPRYFKHDNVRSFVRQLNIYGFQRCRTTSTSRGAAEGQLEFYHQSFLEGRPELMTQVTRGVPSSKMHRLVYMHDSSSASNLGGGEMQLHGGHVPPAGIPTDAAALLREMQNVHESLQGVDQQLRHQVSHAPGGGNMACPAPARA